jgi:hypothetical protein
MHQLKTDSSSVMCLGECPETSRLCHLAALGFNIGCSGAHTARTLMLDEISTLLSQLPLAEGRNTFLEAILVKNILSKSTTSSRKRTFEHLISLYVLDSGALLFRLLRHFWRLDPAGRGLTVLVSARARDPLLQLGSDFLLRIPIGDVYDPAAFEDFIERTFPVRFSNKTRRSLAQNIASTFTQTGFFDGRVKKVRRQPKPSVGAVALSTALGKLSGFSGISLWESPWFQILDLTPSTGDELAREASRRGWIDYRRLGEVISLSFRHLVEELKIKELA